jgi:single-strand DNA-binding protein
MARSENLVILIGNLGQEPSIRSTSNGTTTADFTLATSKRIKDSQGNWQARTEWHNLVAFGRKAEIIRDHVKKGSKLYVRGELQTNSWNDKETGEKRYKTEILINELNLLSTKVDDEENNTATGDQISERAEDVDADELSAIPF